MVQVRLKRGKLVEQLFPLAGRLVKIVKVGVRRGIEQLEHVHLGRGEQVARKIANVDVANERPNKHHLIVIQHKCGREHGQHGERGRAQPPREPSACLRLVLGDGRARPELRAHLRARVRRRARGRATRRAFRSIGVAERT